MTNWYGGKQQHWNKEERNLQMSREVNDYKGGILAISIAYDTNGKLDFILKTHTVFYAT